MSIDNPARLIEFVKTHFLYEEYIFKEDGEWMITDEWLVGTFAGRSFIDKTVEAAAQHLIEYLNYHIGHDSIVGNTVKASGWPDENAVAAYIEARDMEKEQE